MGTLDNDPSVRVIVVTGTGRQFCVGADAKALDFHAGSAENHADTVTSEEYARPGSGVNPEFEADLVWQWGLRVPVIAAINGACAGIAAALVSFCDLRFAAAGAKFTTSTPRLGLPSEYGLSWILPRIVGTTHAADILFTGRVVTAEELLHMGFLNGVHPAGEDFLGTVYETARMIATEVSPASVTSAKRQLYADLLHARPGFAVEQSKELIRQFTGQPDFREGIRAFSERRRPEFAPPVIAPRGP
jgi:enoyl-CoA hydratase/carnithine racemase